MISIIIPIYNQADKIGECLDSLLLQTYKDFEVIVVNDGSSDNLEKIINEYKESFSNEKIVFKFFEQPNKGAPAARNKGFKESKGEYILFCDADAILKRNALEVMVNELKKDELVSYVYPSFTWGAKFFEVGEFGTERLKSAPFIHTMALIKRKDLPEKPWDESIRKLQDWDLWLTMLENGKIGKWVPQNLFIIQTGGTMSSWLPSFAYKLLPFLPSVKKYKKAVKTIKNKHKIN